MKDYVAQRFRDHLPSVPFFLVLEFTPSGKLHAHGAVAVIGDPRAVKTGLMKVAGDARKIEHQAVRFFHNCKAVLVTEPTFAKQFSGRRGLFGWASYCGKNLVETTALLGGSPIARSLSVSKHARRIHADIVGM